MYIRSISIENYRNLKKTEIFPSERINVIYGDNAQGKTNLIECLWLFTGGRSFRGAKDNELVAFGNKSANAEIKFYSREREQNIKLTIQNGKRTAVLNDVPVSYVSQIIGSFCSVIFSPNHLTLVKNGPDERRSFTDAAICQAKPLYAAILAKYKRVLTERNALLKDIPKHRELEDTLEIWNERLAHEGSAIAFERFRYIESLKEKAVKFYEGISNGREKLDISYKPSFNAKSDMTREELKKIIFTKLCQKQNDDINCGFTTVGTHRDDISIKIDGREARNFGSQGQQRSAVLSMKLAEAEVLKEKTGETPVILLDDVLSELDRSRKNYLLNKLSGFQVFITCCEDDIECENKFLIKNGEIKPEG